VHSDRLNSCDGFSPHIIVIIITSWSELFVSQSQSYNAMDTLGVAKVDTSSFEAKLKTSRIVGGGVTYFLWLEKAIHKCK
jgi:hypothetical protein